MLCKVITTNLERRMQHKRLRGLCTKIVNDTVKLKLNRCDFKCVFKVENVRDRRTSTGTLFQARGPATARARSPMVERCVADTRTSAVDAERNVVDDISLRLIAAGSTRSVTVVLLRLDSGALERKVYTRCVQAHAASAGSRSNYPAIITLKQLK